MIDMWSRHLDDLEVTGYETKTVFGEVESW